MTPSDNRRYWRALPVTILGCGVFAVVLANLGLGSAWIYLSVAVTMGVMIYYVHHDRPGEESEREAFARECGLPYPPPGRKRLRKR